MVRTTSGLLLAAGRGTRLRPLTDEVAKPALPVLDVPLGAWGLAALASHAMPITVNVSHLPETVTDALGGRGARFDVLNEEPDPLGTGGTLRALRERAGERLVVWNADAIADVDLDELLRSHAGNGQLATLAVKPVASRADFTLSEERIERLIDRRHEDAPGARFIGVAVYERQALDLLDERVPLGATEGLLVPLLERGELAAFVHDGYARDVGTLDRYLRVSLDLLEGLAPAPPRDPPGELVRVAGGRAYVGPRCDVDATSLGPGAIVLAGASLRRAAGVTRSIVWPGERVPPGAELRDCVWFGDRAWPVKTPATD